MMVTSKAVMACFFDFVRCDLRCGDPVNPRILLFIRDSASSNQGFSLLFIFGLFLCVTNVYIFSVPFALCLNLNGVHNILN